MKKSLSDIISEYIPVNEQERADKELMLSFLAENDDCFSRENRNGHFTASAWIMNKDRTRVLFCYHNIYDSWSWTGGHADGDSDLFRVALKEAVEETGASVIEADEKILSLEILTVAGHMKKGEYISGHVHYNLTFLVIADENAPVRKKDDENSDVRWINADEAGIYSTEKWMIENIYNKILNKLG